MTRLRPLIIWGASGQAKVLHEFAGSLGFELVAVFDNDSDIAPPFDTVPLHHGISGFHDWRRQYRGERVAALLAIGSSGRDRLELQRFLEEHDIEIIQAIHPTAFVARDAVLGKGCQVLAQSVVAAGARMGDQCIVNTSASVDHESVLDDGVHVAPGARILGCVRVGTCTFIGAGAVILPWLEIGSNAVVGAGSIVTRAVPDGATVYGNPARVRSAD